ncbi:hypothetical protein B0H10DRAFT_1823132 [Mycena sp. CBHHK59/15]|nr:hypothetical protein B0H10DRAFT_1823132 [Mycena sp. CBHHK59/15]
MSTYWDAYKNFVHNARAPLQREFRLLAAQCGWEASGERYRTEWMRCARTEFTHYFGGEDNRLAGWQSLCALVGVEDVPESIVQCKQALHNVWVNIFDLIDAQRTGKPVKRHASAVALGKYSKKTSKIFPKAEAKKNRFLKAFLIKMF